ncbi:nitrite reductase [Shewanella mangrovi]|uniref:Nitrite reductase n=2 Tax=Shewanella TaxID=22 RepID=A0A094JFR2_9GAMM|nr:MULTISPECIES: nitrite reductase small subunit NirD [Shewanella]KFZ38800.1 nitrite reductase [Shewanella mangrovi]QSX32367.1 nitrite reductase small subunit NirD [Shewanella avicenniae]
MSWERVCDPSALPVGKGIAAWVAGRAVAIFNLGQQGVFALDNRDPASGVSLLARGQICELAGELYVCSPLYKQHYRLTTGECLEEPQLSAEKVAVRIDETGVWLAGA